MERQIQIYLKSHLSYKPYLQTVTGSLLQTVYYHKPALKLKTIKLTTMGLRDESEACTVCLYGIR